MHTPRLVLQWFASSRSAVSLVCSVILALANSLLLLSSILLLISLSVSHMQLCDGHVCLIYTARVQANENDDILGVLTSVFSLKCSKTPHPIICQYNGLSDNNIRLLNYICDETILVDAYPVQQFSSVPTRPNPASPFSLARARLRLPLRQ